MTLEYSNSARRDFRSYALLFIGLVFAAVGATVSPDANCDESGRVCAPWLVPIAFCMGVFAIAGGVALLFKDFRWGSRIDLQQRRLLWWDTRQSNTIHGISLDEIARIKVRMVHDGGDKLFFYDGEGSSLPIPKDEVFPHPYEEWARCLADRFPHLILEVEGE